MLFRNPKEKGYLLNGFILGTPELGVQQLPKNQTFRSGTEDINLPVFWYKQPRMAFQFPT